MLILSVVCVARVLLLVEYGPEVGDAEYGVGTLDDKSVIIKAQAAIMLTWKAFRMLS